MVGESITEEQWREKVRCLQIRSQGRLEVKNGGQGAEAVYRRGSSTVDEILLCYRSSGCLGSR